MTLLNYGTPSPQHHNQLDSTGYQFIWRLHRAVIKPKRIHHGPYYAGLDRYLPGYKGLSYMELEAHYREHREQWSMVLNGPLSLPPHQVAALLSLECSIGIVGLASSAVIWHLLRREGDELENAWGRYVWPKGKLSEEEHYRREIEYAVLIGGYETPVCQIVLAGNWTIPKVKKALKESFE